MLVGGEWAFITCPMSSAMHTTWGSPLPCNKQIFSQKYPSLLSSISSGAYWCCSAPLELQSRSEKALGQSFIATLCTDVKIMLPNIALECFEAPTLFTRGGGCFRARNFE